MAGKVLALIMAGGAGDRLQPLTKGRAKSAVPFGGAYRLIDFVLSNCVNSAIRRIFVLTQYRSSSLHQHIQEGWGISSAGLGDYVYCVPAQQKLGTDWYRGTADAVRQNLDLMTDEDVEHVLILSGDHVYKMNYAQLVDYHTAKRADVTISAVRVRKGDAARRLGVLEADHDHRLVGFEEKPAEPKTMPEAPDHALASMGIYLFKAGFLRDALQAPGDDFGKEVIPQFIGRDVGVFVYDFERENKIEDFVIEVREGLRRKVLVNRTRDSSYWKDVGTIDSYYEASMDLIGVDPSFSLYGERWPIRSHHRPLPPGKCILGGLAPESLVSDGCIISGGIVSRSILSPGVAVERGALVERAVVFDDVIIEPSARVNRAIVDKYARIAAGASVGFDRDADKERGCSVTDSGIVVVPKGMVVPRSR